MNLPPASIRSACVSGLVPLFVRTDLSRVVVVGSSNNGKTQFASELAKHHGCAHLELDALISEAALLSPRRCDEDRTSEFLAPYISQGQWVADGNDREQCDAVLPYATCVIWLRYSLPVVFGRAVRGIGSREQSYRGKIEAFGAAFLSGDGSPWWILKKHHQRLREYTNPILRRQLPFVELTSPAMAKEFLRRIGSEANSRQEKAGHSPRTRNRSPQPQASPPSCF